MDSVATGQFLARLWELQAAAGLSNAVLAQQLGCHPTYISHLRAGRRGGRIGLDIALKAASLFPELRRFFLLAELPVGNTEIPHRQQDEGVQS